jgi:hypothetical protein
MSARQYASRVDFHSRIAYNSLYAGLNYTPLAKFLHENAFLPRTVPHSNNPRQLPDLDAFALLYELGPNTIPKATPLSLTTELPSLTSNSIIFLQGYPSARWLNEVGAKYGIDPEVFNRHMSYIRTDTQHDHVISYNPPSSCRTTFQTTITSIGSVSLGRYDLKSLRNTSHQKMQDYLTRLKNGTRWQTCHSVVRSFSVLDVNHCSFDQTITIHVDTVDKNTGRWLGMY